MRPNRTDIFAGLSGMPAPLRALVEGRMTIPQLRALRPLPEDAQKQIDDAVVRVGLDRLAVTADIMAENLTYNLGQDFWGITQLQWDEISKAGGAKRTMEPQARGESSIVDRRPRVLPVYLTWDNFDLGIRTMSASRRSGAPIDTTMIEETTRRVNEAIEDATINGLDFSVFGNSVPGLLTAPNVNSFTYGSNVAWDNASKTGQAIVDDVLDMIDLARTARRFGPYTLYVNTTYGNVLNKNFSDGTTTFAITIRERIEQIVAGGRPLRVREADMLPANRTALVQMTSDVVDVVVGQQPTVISWDDPSGLSTNWMVLACIITRVKTDYADKSGIVIGNV